jgi:hypothetical protein
MSILNFLKELMGISNREYRRVEISLVATSAAVGQFTDTYRVPAGTKLIITGMRGHLSLLTAADWGPPGAGVTLEVSELIKAKAMNVKLDIINQDTQDSLTENKSLNLASIMDFGGNNKGVDWREAPHIVPAGQTLKMTATVVTNSVALVTNTEYGVVFTGFLISKP